MQHGNPRGPSQPLRFGLLFAVVLALGLASPLSMVLADPTAQARPTARAVGPAGVGSTATPTATLEGKATATPTPTATLPAATATPTATATRTPTSGPTSTPTATPTQTQTGTPAPPTRTLLVSDLKAELLAKAEPDECFTGVGQIPPPGPPCTEGQLKVNQAYVWGLTKIGSQVWFGTGANVNCIFGATYGGTTAPELTPDFVCERSRSWRVQTGLIPAKVGDWRPPKVYRYDTTTNVLTDRTPNLDPRFQLTLGIRSAGAFNNVVLFGGPAFSTGGGINVFAYRADTGQYLGSRHFDEYGNIRKWVLVNGVLYTGVLKTGGGGAVLRWNGSVGSPFQFQVVANLDNEVSELAEHEGRLFVSTWSILTETAGTCPATGCPLPGLWMSPPVPPTGLTAADSGLWQQVWRVDDYEPDEITARGYGNGALQSFGGYLYWGTMQPPGLATRAHDDAYGKAKFFAAGRRKQRVERAISIFRGQNFGTTPTLQLLYGETSVQVYTPGSGWKNTPTGMGPPLYGKSGFGNPDNRYTWTMAVYNGALYVGTFDISPIANRRGGDLWRFPSTSQAAQAVSLDGVGNYLNRGFRTMLADDALYVGMANPNNLRTDLPDTIPEGGWELLSIETK